MSKNPLTVVGGVVSLIGTILIAVWVFTASGNDLSPDQRNLAFITIVGLVANAVPSVLALLKSEATQHDIKNGLIPAKVSEALQQPHVQNAVKETVATAIAEQGVVTRQGPAMTLAMEGLAQLLRNNTQVVEQNTAVHTDTEGKTDG